MIAFQARAPGRSVKAGAGGDDCSNFSPGEETEAQSEWKSSSAWVTQLVTERQGQA